MSWHPHVTVATIVEDYRSNPELTSKVMRPSATFNAAIDSLA